MRVYVQSLKTHCARNPIRKEREGPVICVVGQNGRQLKDVGGMSGGERKIAIELEISGTATRRRSGSSNSPAEDTPPRGSLEDHGFQQLERGFLQAIPFQNVSNHVSGEEVGMRVFGKTRGLKKLPAFRMALYGELSLLRCTLSRISRSYA